ncbi:MAG TPA: DUF3108 domain-containing protein [Anaeromyxobacteraceae bacterium]|nr:DUF3108 domain-containing protein [Anaeromyxobacteraceae bacterium]
MIAAVILAAVAAGAGPGCDLPPLAGPAPWRTGESLDLDLDLYGVVRAGALVLSVERPISGGRVVSLRAVAKSTAAMGDVKRLTAVALSWVDSATLLPERTRVDSEEDGVRRSSDARLLPAGPEVVLENRTGDREARAVYPRERTTLDGVSALYYLRAARLAPGDRFCLDAVALGRLWRVEGSVGPRVERVETPAGTFRALRIDLVGRRADRPEVRREIHLWLSEDARRLPVAAVGEVDLGPVRALLAGVRGARSP